MPTRRDEMRDKEKNAVEQARRDQRAVSYIDDDGCEVTVTPQGHVFYNAADWW